MLKKILAFTTIMLCIHKAEAQLTPGFDKAEYLEFMKVSERTSAEEN